MILRIGPAWSRRTLLVVAVCAVAVAGVGLVMLTGSDRSAPHSQPKHRVRIVMTSPAEQGSTVPSSRAAPAPAALARTDDPAQYARDVATALFDVAPSEVTRTAFLQFWRDELPTVVYSDAAAKGLTLAAQNADAIANLTHWWIPSAVAWSSEAADQTTNRLAITSISVPDYWVNAVAAGTFRDPGLHMERVFGVVNQQYGTNPQHRYTSTRSVVIDLGLLCGPTQPDGCRLVAPQQPLSVGSD